MGILGNEAADVIAKQVKEVPPDGHETWMSGGGIQNQNQFNALNGQARPARGRARPVQAA